jgi:hypothetical protein
MIVSRLFGLDALKSCWSLLEGRSRVGGSTPLDEESFVKHYTKYFMDPIKDQIENYYAFGCFENNILISWIAISLMENKSRGKFWIIVMIASNRPRSIFTFNNPETGLLIKECFKLAESMGHYDFYYTVADRISKVYETQIAKTDYIPIGRYDKEDLAIIPANTWPEVELYQRLLGGAPKPDTIIVKHRKLKEEYRVPRVSNQYTDL